MNLPPFPRPSFLRCLASFVYETILLAALLATATFFFISVFGDATKGIEHYFLQLFLWFVSGAYFVWCWVKSGQTLAMQTWRIQLVGANLRPISLRQACMRYCFATIFFGAGFLWALFDRERLFLHDRLTGGRLVVLPKKQG